MLIKKIRIENIRSYVDETIELPVGSLLLAGDIGSGKSTILLSVEFALFGIMKGDTSGSHLLRHGAKEGSVTLTLDINNKEVTIKRSLKRTSSAIQQEAGYIIIDGRKTDLVAKELKARMLQLLGYSENMLNKSKSLIYRYTVYTPQEDMKRIILSTPEERLNTLRSVFGIDKYKTIRENISMYSRELKRNISYMQGQVLDLDDLKNIIEEKKKEKEEIEKSLKETGKQVEKRKEDIKKVNDEIIKKEKEIEKIRASKNNVRFIESKIENTKKNIKSYEERILFENERILQLEKEIQGSRKINEDKLSQKISEIKNEILKERKNINEIVKLIGQSEYKKNESQKISQKVSSLVKCPVCLQDVDDEHKHNIIEDNKNNVNETEKTLQELHKEKIIIDKKVLDFEKKREEYDSIQKKAEVILLKTKLLEEKNIEIKDYVKKIEEQKIVLEKLRLEKENEESKLKGTEEVEKSYLTMRQEFLKIQTLGKNEEITFARLTEQNRANDENILHTIKQIESKEELKKKIIIMNQSHNWLTGFFENLMLTMEKHVFAKIYYEFNDLVAKWFQVLIGDESITLKLDNEFTPSLEQNGYETDIENLSGGEKTAVALSYRLALNKVINDVVSNINTKDIIILDEPTDGFSSEQLDRVKEVIEELELKQVIIVSHESKVEGFVNSVVRIVKNEHESKIVV